MTFSIPLVCVLQFTPSGLETYRTKHNSQEMGLLFAYILFSFLRYAINYNNKGGANIASHKFHHCTTYKYTYIN